MKKSLFLIICGLLLPCSAKAQSSLQARALLYSSSHTILSSQVAGKIKKINFREGDSFNKGDSLFSMDCTLEWANLNKAKAEISAAMNRLNHEKKLAEYGSGTALDLELAKDGLAKASAEKQMAETTLNMCDVRAPFTGKVLELKSQPYQSVAPGKEVVEIIDTSDFEIQVIVPSNWLSWLKKGSKFSIAIDENGRTYTGRVEKIGSMIDAASQTIKIYGEFIGSTAGLIAGMSGTATFEGQ